MTRPIKDVVFNNDAKLPLIKGVNIVCDAVSATYGYNGRTVLIEDEGGYPKPTLDGVTVAKSVFLDDAIESLGAEYVKQAAQKTVDEAGDGTTLTCVLTQAFVNASEELLQKGFSVNDVKKSLENVKNNAISLIKANSRKVTLKDYYNVASISANNDEVLGKIISDAFKSAGKNGIVTFERSGTKETYFEHIDGMPIERGLYHKGYANQADGSVVFENPLILVTDKNLKSIREITNILEHIYESQKSLLIIGDVSDELNNSLLANKIKNNLSVAVIQPPSSISKRTEYLKDIALVTGAVMLDTFSGDLTDGYGLNLLGTCRKFIIGKNDSVLVKENNFKNQEISAKIKELKVLLKDSTFKYEKSFLADRISKLSCGVSIIKVGAITDAELTEKLDRVEDAIHAVRSSIISGISAGGGVGYLNVYKEIGTDNCNGVIKTCLLAPIKKINILYNQKLPLNQGLNLVNNTIGDMFDMGIIDPTLVHICALENSISVATTILSTDVCITYKRA
jgi:chaperonin GroEL